MITERWKLPHGGHFRQHQHHGRYKGGVSYSKRGKQEKGESSEKGNKESKGGLIDGGGDCQQGRGERNSGKKKEREGKRGRKKDKTCRQGGCRISQKWTTKHQLLPQPTGPKFGLT